MRVIAESAHGAGGKVIGVVPECVKDDKIYPNSDETITVSDLSSRKKVMREKSFAALIFPGGHGTLDELEEDITLSKFLEKHNNTSEKRNRIIVDPNGFFKPYIKMLRNMGRVKGNRRDENYVIYAGGNADKVLLHLGILPSENYDSKYGLIDKFNHSISNFLAKIFNGPISEHHDDLNLKITGAFATAGGVSFECAKTALENSLNADNIALASGLGLTSLTCFAAAALVGTKIGRELLIKDAPSTTAPQLKR